MKDIIELIQQKGLNHNSGMCAGQVYNLEKLDEGYKYTSSKEGIEIIKNRLGDVAKVLTDNTLLVEMTLRERHKMPQINNYDSFISDLLFNGINVTNEKDSPNTFIPTQSEFNDDKVKGMIQSGTWSRKPIIVSSDNYIIDGHHRWKAATETGQDIMASKVKASFEDIYEFLQNKPYVSYEKV